METAGLLRAAIKVSFQSAWLVLPDERTDEIGVCMPRPLNLLAYMRPTEST